MSHMAKQWARILFQGIAILALSAALMALTLEAWARLQPRRFFLEHDPELGFRLEPGAVGEYRGRWLLSPNPAIRTPVRINSLGIRGPEIAIPKPEGNRRLLILGDSYVQALEVPYADTFYALLAESVRASGAPLLEPVPMGVTGYGQAQQLLWLQKLGVRLEPDLVVASVFLGNDITDNSQEIGLAATRPYFELRDGELHLVERPKEAARWKYDLAKYMRSFIVYKEIGHKVSALRRMAGSLGVVNYVDVEGATGSELVRKRTRAWRLTFALLKEMARISESAEAPFLAVFHGSYPTGSADSVPEAIRRRCAEAGFECLDLNPGLTTTDEHFVPTDLHWSAPGHAKVAELIWQHWEDPLRGRPAGSSERAHASREARRHEIPEAR